MYRLREEIKEIYDFLDDSFFSDFLYFLIRLDKPVLLSFLKKRYDEEKICKIVSWLDEKRYIKKIAYGNDFLLIPQKELLYLINKVEYRSFKKKKRSSVIGGDERRRALLLVDGRGLLDDGLRGELRVLFKRYLERVYNARVVVVGDGRVRVVGGRSRFNRFWLERDLRKLRGVFREAGLRYGDAVFLTLTCDSRRYGGLRGCVEKAYEAWNRFRYYLDKWSGKKPFVNVIEFTRSGLLHFHVVVFGVRRLVDVREISRVWSRVGLGEIVYVYRLVNRNGRFFSVRRLKHLGGIDIETYLTKMLRKGLRNPLELYMYWLSNKHFFSFSKDLEPGMMVYKIERMNGFVFVGIFREGHLPLWVLDSDPVYQVFWIDDYG